MALEELEALSLWGRAERQRLRDRGRKLTAGGRQGYSAVDWCYRW